MTTRNLAVAVVAAALGLLVLGATVAPAAVTVRTDPGGALLTGPTTLRNTTSDAAVLTTSTGALTCTQASFDAHLTANTSSSIIGGGLTALTLTACRHAAACQHRGVRAARPDPAPGSTDQHCGRR